MYQHFDKIFSFIVGTIRKIKHKNRICEIIYTNVLYGQVLKILSDTAQQHIRIGVTVNCGQSACVGDLESDKRAFCITLNYLVKVLVQPCTVRNIVDSVIKGKLTHKLLRLLQLILRFLTHHKRGDYL